MIQAQAFQELLDKFVSDDPFIHNGVLMVGTPSFVWTGASGFSNPELRIPMQAEDQFQLASVTKMFTASALITLVEEGLVELDAGINSYLPPSLMRASTSFRDRNMERTSRRGNS